jgi:hypothetical protein
VGLVMVCCTFGKMNKGSTTEERKEFNMTTLVWFTSFLLENLFYYDRRRVSSNVTISLGGSRSESGEVDDQL